MINRETSISQTIGSYIRVLKLARKPKTNEFLNISKISAVGITVIGLVGFVIYIMMSLLSNYI